MCRFVAYLGPSIVLDHLITKPRNSLIHQSYEAEDTVERLNGDGFGVAWYAHSIAPEPAVFRSVSPAWSNMNLLSIARLVHSSCILAHVRAASFGIPVHENNCHPFVHKNIAFMHNGELGGFHDIRRTLRRGLSDVAYDVVSGSTDTEHLFGIFLDELWKLDDALPTHERFVCALQASVAYLRQLQKAAQVTEISYLNVAVTDGHALGVMRYTDGPAENALTLYTHTGRYHYDGQVARMKDHKSRQSVLVSSERLCDDEGWKAIAVNHVVGVGAGLELIDREVG